MKRQINIIQGDEYRAKVETEFVEAGFFQDVYLRARKIVAEIVEETKAYNKQSQQEKGYKIKYQGFGNNIIVFTAERGQGKTSAMQSFAGFLREPSQDNGVLRKIDDAWFEVLDPIEPSTLDSKENIIRVLISRLFFAVGKIQREQNSATFGDERFFQEERKKILELFKKCYANIDSLKGNEIKDDYSDDLDKLARLGSSAKMKEHLHDLVMKYLQIKQNKADAENAFLVVQIDDADLATGNVFEICEDIHNYLSIPNVIVMMAFNDRQLSYVIYQKYLEQYRSIFQLQKKLDISEKCYEMAVKYLEKTFPNGRQIILPKIDEAISDEIEEIEINYFDKEGRLIFGGDLQSWPLKAIYERTGIFCAKKSGVRHPLLPCSLRELTQFVKLLNEMETIDFKEVGKEHFVLNEKRVRTESDKLKRNIKRLKEFFLNDWCALHLDIAQKELLWEIDSLNKKYKISGTLVLLHKYFKVQQVDQEVTYDKFLNMLKDNAELQKEKMLQEGLVLLFTLFVHDWLNSVWSDEEGMQELADYVGSVNNVVCSMSDGKSKSYQKLEFELDIKKMKNNFKNSGDESFSVPVRDYLDLLCRVQDKQGRTIPISAQQDSDKNYWNPRLHSVKFEVMRPVMTMLTNRQWAKISGEQLLENKTDKTVVFDSVGEAQGGQEGEKAEQKARIVDYLLCSRSIAFNEEVQQYISSAFGDGLLDDIKDKSGEPWTAVCRNIYAQIDALMAKVGFGITVGLSDICGGYIQDSELVAGIFLSNSSNVNRFVKEYKAQIDINLNLITKKLDAIELERKNKKEDEEGEKIEELAYSWLLQLKNVSGNENLSNVENYQPTVIKGSIKLTNDIKKIYERAEKVAVLYREMQQEMEGITENSDNGRNMGEMITKYRTAFEEYKEKKPVTVIMPERKG